MKDVIIKFKDGNVASLKDILYNLAERYAEFNEFDTKEEIKKTVDLIIRDVTEAIEKEIKKANGSLRPALKQKFINVVSERVKLYWDWQGVDFVLIIK